MKAVVHGLSICIEQGFSKIEVKSDSLSVVNIFSKATTHPWYVIYWKYQFDCISSAGDISIRYIPREANRVADSLARWGSNNQQNKIFRVPSDLLPPLFRGELVLDRIGIGMVPRVKRNWFSRLPSYTQPQLPAISSVGLPISTGHAEIEKSDKVPLTEIQLNSREGTLIPSPMSDPVSNIAKSTDKENSSIAEDIFGVNKVETQCLMELEAAPETAGRMRDKVTAELEIDLSPYFMADNDQDQHKDQSGVSDEFWNLILDGNQSQKDPQLFDKEGSIRKFKRHRILYEKGNWTSRLRQLKRRAVNTVALLEPMLGDEKRIRTGLALGLHSSSNGSEGGKIWIFFKSVVSCSVLFKSDQCLSILVDMQNCSLPLHITFVYARCVRILRRALWSDSVALSSSMQGPWTVCGDFNAMVNDSERRSRRVVDRASSTEFADAIHAAGLQDAGFSGSRFSWNNNQAGSSRVWARLDHAFINVHWSMVFPQFLVSHLPRTQSDHAPFLLSFPLRQNGGPKPFRFQRMWTQHESFLLVVKSAWEKVESAHPMYNVLAKLKQVKLDLKHWNKEVFGNIFEQIKTAERDMCDLENKLLQVSSSVEQSSRIQQQLSSTSDRLASLELMEEIFWKQKWRVDWLTEGDKNTKFFHTTATERQRRALIHPVELDTSHIMEDQEELKAAAAARFQQIFSAADCQMDYNLLQCIPNIVTPAQNESLLAPPSMLEVHAVVQSMPIDSAASPNGFSASFFISCWNVIGQDIHNAISFIFKGGNIPRSATSSFICLILKSASPRRFLDFRLISLSENIALAQELFEDLNKLVRCGNIVLKLDLDKAYDRVNWDFLILVLERFGFCKAWIKIVKKCWVNSWFSVLINEEMTGFFKSSRGLRQGDPISPSLFILSAEVMSKSLKCMINQQVCRLFALRRGCPVVSHLLYADDTLIFTNGGKRSLQALKNFLDSFQASSEGKEKCHWKTWKVLASPKEEGGIGIRRLTDIMTAFQLKMAWVIRFGREINVWKYFMAAKYHLDLSPTLSDQPTRLSSPLWKWILDLIPFVDSRVLWQIGDGKCNFWQTNWTGLGLLSLLIQPEVLVELQDLEVCNVLGPVGPFPPSSAWLLLPQGVIDQIFHASFCIGGDSDTPIWPFTLDGDFSIRSAWALMQSRGVQLASRCVCCTLQGSQVPSIHAQESALHLFIASKLAQRVWYEIDRDFQIAVMEALSIEARLQQWWAVVLSKPRRSLIQMLTPCIILWEIWKARNAATFDLAVVSAESVSGKIRWWMARISGSTAGACKATVGRQCRQQLSQAHSGFDFGGRAFVVKWERPPHG
ncbi:uncharacterized protein LOC131244025 [Magnolia sinica]|uniref:uncharacterized protein LOC131244025 n=1 Tax=Magnolia sinica TaxID=86752 RepID=UPI002658AF0C|nr:uncharacterized protein LOC131244025 [Magnolia sinica]